MIRSLAAPQGASLPPFPPPIRREGSLPPEVPHQSSKEYRDALLLKMALEGKDFQEARRELDQQPALEGTSGGPESPSTAEALPDIGLTVTEIHAQVAALEIHTPDSDIHLSAASLQVSRIQASQQRAAAPSRDPLLLDLDGHGAETTGLLGARTFDLNGDGQLERVSFVQGSDAFLALDRNGDGLINSGKELFGDQHGAPDGFAELSRFDSNGDGVINQQDPIYQDLRLLFQDGHTEDLVAQSIQTLNLRPAGPGADLPNGDHTLATATATRADGTVLPIHALALQTFEWTV